ncbi:putative GTP-binding protein EngB [Candidatus Magnetomoraceae bacterium gMMP-1]
MIIKSTNFVTSAVKPSQYPPANMPEIAFAGRSNVGKSSLINTILNRKRLARTSSTPGRTQLVNFFCINDSVSFVDLPGYGYANVPKKIKKEWSVMIETYLKTRKNLEGVVLILDIRRIPKDGDINFIDWLGMYKIPSLLILTKIDKLSKSKQIKQKNIIASTLSIDSENLILFSAKSRQGKDIVWEALDDQLRLDKK